MTPQEYVDRVKALVSEGRDAEALRLAAEHAREVLPRLDLEQFAVTTSLLESAQLVIDMADAVAQPRQPGTGKSAAPRQGATQHRTKASRRRA